MHVCVFFFYSSYSSSSTGLATVSSLPPISPHPSLFLSLSHAFQRAFIVCFFEMLYTLVYAKYVW